MVGKFVMNADDFMIVGNMKAGKQRPGTCRKSEPEGAKKDKDRDAGFERVFKRVHGRIFLKISRRPQDRQRGKGQ
jgi:hypothetical protein